MVFKTLSNRGIIFHLKFSNRPNNKTIKVELCVLSCVGWEGTGAPHFIDKETEALGGKWIHPEAYGGLMAWPWLQSTSPGY